MIHGRYIGQGEDITAALIIRESVFTDEFAGYDLHAENDPMALNAVIDLEGEIIGTGRLVLDLIEDRFYVDDIGVLKEFRGNKYGDFMVRMLADKADQCGAKELWALVPDFAKAFFEKMSFKSKGVEDGLSVMKADIKDFKNCCSGCAQNEKKVTDCAQNGCGACCMGK